MKNYIHVCLTVISFFFISCSGDDTNLDTPSISSSPNASVLPSTNEVPEGFLNIDGTTIVDDSGEEYMLKGVAFGNEVWSDKEVPTTHHEEEDFRRVADLNMNSVRFYLNYRTFEDDSNPYTYKETGWEWIDRNIRWSRNHGVKLLLNMHVPQGGFQSNGDGGRLWAEEENKNRLIALWRAIAER